MTKLAVNGDCSAYDWEQLRNFLVDLVRETLQKFNDRYRDSATFEEEQEIILQYLVFFTKYTCLHADRRSRCSASPSSSLMPIATTSPAASCFTPSKRYAV